MSAAMDAPNDRESEQRAKIIATAERLFREIGFQKTTVADIARELRMSPANIYRFFGAKSEINGAVARQLMSEVEAAVEKIARSAGSSSDRLRRMIVANESMNAERYVADRKIHEMVEAAIVENWPIVDEHITFLETTIESVIADGVASGEFAPGDAMAAARLFLAAFARFLHPRLVVECADRPGPTSAQMIEFCLAALREGGFAAAQQNGDNLAML